MWVWFKKLKFVSEEGVGVGLEAVLDKQGGGGGGGGCKDASFSGC